MQIALEPPVRFAQHDQRSTSVRLDVAVGGGWTAAEVLNAAERAEKKLVVRVSLFDVFEGGDLGEGKKSLAVNVVLQPVEKTLTDAEIDAIAEKVVANVTKITGGVLRG